MSPKSLLCYRAGPTALARVRAQGLAGQVRVFVAPATGPKWLVAYGFDQALLASGLLTGPVRTVLAGASAGAWRALCFASPDAAKRHQALAAAYCEQVFGPRDTPFTVRAAFDNMLRTLFEGAERALVSESPYELAIHTARARGSGPGSPARWHLAALGAAAVLNPLAARLQPLALERVTFHTAGAQEALRNLRAHRVALTPDNVLAAALASATVPLSMEPVRAIPGAPPGSYLDGGMTDYHLADPYAHAGGVTLLFSHQPRIVARWLDQRVPWRRPAPSLLDTLVHVYPSPDFIARLPAGRVPSREDFVTLSEQPGERIRRWREAVAASEELGESFTRDLATGAFLEKLRLFEAGVPGS